MHLVELRAAGNEASDLLRVHDPRLLDQLGARAAFWTVLDEGPLEQCLALLALGHDGVWSALHVLADAGGQAGRTEDAEALAYRDGWVYVLGSHFGKKKGPLRPKRAFVARFRESLAPRLEIVRNPFALHRMVNDALAGHTDAPPPGVRESFITATVRRGLERSKVWAAHLLDGDHPINVEGAAFTEAGTLLIGLRWPVTRAGEPLLIEVDWPWGGEPRAVDVYPLHGLAKGPLGVRAVSAREDGSFDVIVGSIDALDKGSVLLDEHPGARDATCRHYRYVPGGSPRLIKDLAPLHHVEGVSELDGRALYVTDEDHRIALYSGPAQ